MRRGCIGRRVVMPALALVIGWAGAGCTGSSPGAAGSVGTSTPTTAAHRVEQPPFTFTTLTRTYVDPSRPTVDPNGTHSAPNRTLVTIIRVPNGHGPFPLVLYAHGYNGHPRKLTHLLDAWARAGYVVAAPVFPLTNDDVARPVVTDFQNQPLDMRFVMRSVLADARHAGPLAGKVDPRRIGVAGHSLGGATAYAFAGSSCCHDRRMKALIAMDTLRIDPAHGHWLRAVDIPLLALHGTADPALAMSLGRAAYAAWPGPKSFVTLIGAHHAEQYEDTPSPYDRLVESVTTLFWNAHLKDDRAAAARLAHWTPPPALATYEP